MPLQTQANTKMQKWCTIWLIQTATQDAWKVNQNTPTSENNSIQEIFKANRHETKLCPHKVSDAPHKLISRNDESFWKSAPAVSSSLSSSLKCTLQLLHFKHSFLLISRKRTDNPQNCKGFSFIHHWKTASPVDQCGMTTDSCISHQITNHDKTGANFQNSGCHHWIIQMLVHLTTSSFVCTWEELVHICVLMQMFHIEINVSERLGITSEQHPIKSIKKKQKNFNKKKRIAHICVHFQFIDLNRHPFFVSTTKKKDSIAPMVNIWALGTSLEVPSCERWPWNCGRSKFYSAFFLAKFFFIISCWLPCFRLFTNKGISANASIITWKFKKFQKRLSKKSPT